MATKRPDGRVEPGQRISSAFSARAWNRAQDAADVVLGARTGATAGEPQGGERASNIVFVRNDSGVDVPRFGVLRLAEPLTNLEKSFQIAIRGFKPIASEPFAVAIEPIKQGSFGRCAIGGAFPVNVEVCTPEHRYANPKDDDVERLYSSTVGQLQIISRSFQTGRMIAVGAM